MDEHALIQITCKTISCIWQGQGDNCWFIKEDEAGPLIKDKICQSFKEDIDQTLGESTQ